MGLRVSDGTPSLRPGLSAPRPPCGIVGAPRVAGRGAGSEERSEGGPFRGVGEADSLGR